PNVTEQRCPLTASGIDLGELAPGPPDPRPLRPISVQSPLSVGLFAGKWCSYSAAPDLPYDQREEDGGALVYQSEPLAATLAVLGAPVREMELEADRPVAMVAVRLSDVLPDDRATRITYGLLNLTHRNGHERPEPLEPGRRYRVRVELNDAAHAFPPGHTIRLAVSTSYWPIAWPTPTQVTLALFPAASRLVLPVRPPRPEDGALRPFGPPEQGPSLAHTELRPARFRRTIERDLASDEVVHVVE